MPRPPRGQVSRHVDGSPIRKRQRVEIGDERGRRRPNHAAVLVTKDKALLKLARRAARDNLFRIMTPDAWVKTEAPATVE